MVNNRRLPRRQLLAAGIAAAGLSSCSRGLPQLGAPKEKAAVTVLRAASYEQELLTLLEEGLRGSWPNAAKDIAGKTVVLKPNLVEFDENTAINTDPRFVLAVHDLFCKLGAGRVLIAEGPGHRRDTWDLAEQAGFRKWIPGFDDKFVDLNLDDVEARRAYGGAVDLYLPKTILHADYVISLAKMKTHHWAGATLSMKNFFGIVPGSIYGWPKNLLHHQGIDRSIVELNRIVRNTFAIIDGITAMEGNGPIQGTPVAMGAIAMGRDLAAVDATCCRLMKLDPLKIRYLRGAANLGLAGLGAIDAQDIEQRGENPDSLARPFAVINSFSHLRLSA
ncbi:DUF362 domain-containing protein [Oscillatoria amoena NRMC-F 0135]|nr:DUF362 domain-containing protein [Oscillatoria amoena NRMC-F 0135]